MKNKLNYLLTAILLAVSVSVTAQYSRSDAIDLVLNTVLQNDIGSVDVYASVNSRNQLQPVEIFNDQTVDCPYPDNWVFFVDDEPFANWMHDCRYIFVDANSGDYSIVNHTILPTELYSNFENIEEVYRPDPAVLPENTQPPGDPVESDIHKFAVLVSANDLERNWYTTSVLYNTLIQKYGFLEENIYIHYYTGYSSNGNGGDMNNDGINDIDYDASKFSIHQTFYNLAGGNTVPEIPELQHGDQLFVFFTGWTDYPEEFWVMEDPVYPTWFVIIYSNELATWLKDIKCSQMTYLLSYNYSGSFKDELTDFTTYNVECENRAVHTSTSATMKTYREEYITGDKYDEYVFYWSAAARGAYPVVNAPWYTSYDVGEFQFETYFTGMGHPLDYVADLNEDTYVQMEEAFSYADFFDTWSIDECYFPFDPGEEEDPQEEIEILFQEPIMTLWGLAGELKLNQTVTGHFVIGKKLTIKNTGWLNFVLSSELYFSDVDSKIYVEGELHIGENTFLLGQDEQFMSLIRTETNSVLTIGSGSEFNKILIELTGYPYMDYLLMDNLTFNNFDITGDVVSIDVLNTDFNNGWFQISNCYDFYMNECFFNYSHAIVSGNSELSSAIITNCKFICSNTLADAIWLGLMPKYNFSGNNIHGYSTGLCVFDSGEGKVMARINDNEIKDNIENGILIYNSHAYFRNNNIHDNYENGISLLNNSYIKLIGDQEAHFVSETQRFRDNGMYEIFTDDGSFPEYFKWNAIIDEDNNQDGYELVYCESEQSVERDVRYNYWGSEETFDPSEDLYPAGDYSYFLNSARNY